MSGIEEAFSGIATAIGVALLALAALQILVQVAQLVGALAAMRRGPVETGSRGLWRRTGEALPPITLIAPAYNEVASVVESVRSLLNLRYPQFEVVVVNDGSTDATLAALVEAFQLTPTRRSVDMQANCRPLRGLYASPHQARLLVIDKANGGKADALNAGLNLARYPLVCAMDSDSLLEPQALLQAVQPFLDDPDRVIAVGGSIRIVNGCRVEDGRVSEVKLPDKILPLFQVGEYCRAFMIARMAWGHVGALTIISGAFGLFRRDAALAVGGYSHGTVGEDMELILKLHRWFLDRGLAYRIAFAPDPVCWTQAPDTLRDLGRQRARWQRGALETFSRHADMLFRRRYGRVGALAMGNVLVTDVLGPCGEIAAYVLLPLFAVTGALSWAYLSAFLAMSVGFGVAISVAGLALDETQKSRASSIGALLRLLNAAVIENLGYRQLCNYWRVVGSLQFLRGDQGWGTMNRSGFSPRVPANA